jgi:hypothetical protein
MLLAYLEPGDDPSLLESILIVAHRVRGRARRDRRGAVGDPLDQALDTALAPGGSFYSPKLAASEPPQPVGAQENRL